jgi:hypothetical protein
MITTSRVTTFYFKPFLVTFPGIFLGLALLCQSCVSVNLGPGKAVRAKNVEFTPPANPFKEMGGADTDKAWQSEVTGNVIAFFSECGSSDPSLSALLAESLQSLNDSQVEERKDMDFNERTGLFAKAIGRVDGVPVALQILVFKKDGCNFTLTYNGKSNLVAREARQFDGFLSSFKVK